MGTLLDTPLADLQADVREVKRAQAQLQTHLDLLEMAIRVKLAQTGESIAPDLDELAPDERPSLREAIIRVMADRPSRAWKPREIYAELEKRNWQPRGVNGKNQLHARLSKMNASNQVVARNGSYTLPTIVDVED
jgi:hypothetical protein